MFRLLVGIGTPRTPLPQANVFLPRNQRGGTHSPAGEGVGEFQLRRLKEKPSSLSTLWLT